MLQMKRMHTRMVRPVIGSQKVILELVAPELVGPELVAVEVKYILVLHGISFKKNLNCPNTCTRTKQTKQKSLMTRNL